MPNRAAGERPSIPGTVAALSESDLIARIHAHLPPPPPWMVVGIGDDAAVVEPERNRLDVLTVDGIVEGVHFDRAFVPCDAVGHRALAVNLSDLAAMGSAPRLALLAMALPADLSVADYDDIVSGFCTLATEHRVHVAGGNLTRTPGPLTIDVTLAGTVKRRQVLTRAGARPGDDLYVSGTIGAASAGLHVLQGRREPLRDATAEDARDTEDGSITTAGVPDAVSVCIERYLRPSPRVRLGIWLGRNRAATACIDLSDGLADGVHRIAAASGVGILVDGDALPIDTGTRAVFGADSDPIGHAIAGGDDYELLFTAPPRARRLMDLAARYGGVTVTRIGECTKADAVLLRSGGRDVPLPRVGFSHFGAA